MEIPNLVRRQLGGEEVEAGVNLGDEDTICLTPSRTLLYRAEGLLSDEKVEEFPHNVERLDVKEGRRKTKFVLEYVEGNRTFSVPKNRDTQVLELLMDGILREADVTADDESVTGVFRFSELALVVTEGRVVKHIGSSVWSDDYEVFAYDDLSELSFERGSVATEVVMTIDGRPQRIKTPNDHARKVQQVIERAVFSYYGVDSLEQLNRKIKTDESDTGGGADTQRAGGSSGSSDIEIGGGIDPLVEDDEPSEGSQSPSSDTPRTSESSSRQTPGRDEAGASSTESSGQSTASGNESSPSSGTVEVSDTDSADIEAVEAQLDELTTAVQKQNDLLRKQQRTIKQLIEELREGR